jgi:hypothetical protein
VLLDALVGLGHLHAHGVIHGDVKPANILVDSRERGLLADFNISIDTKSRTSAAHVTRKPSTIRATALGMTTGFAAPELQTSGQATTHTDMFAYGKTVSQVGAQCEPGTAAADQGAEGILDQAGRQPRLRKGSSTRQGANQGQAAALVEALTAPSPSDRWSAEAATQHPFFTILGEIKERVVLAPPEHWTSGAGSNDKLSLVEVPRDAGVFDVLKELLNGTGIGDGGRDQQQPGAYSRLELAAAWRVENHDIYCAYKVAQRKVLSFAAKVPVRGDTKVRIRKELYGSASKLPGDLETGCNEVRLLHGTKPDLVWRIVQQGLNERFAGASAGTRFGDGSYFSDDAGKIDQYAVKDEQYDAALPLHQRLYSDSSSRHPGSVFYAFVFRVTLGHSVQFDKRMDKCFNANSKRRELENIPNTETPYHSLVAAGIYRYNEYVIFHSDQTYPEYVLAYQRR